MTVPTANLRSGAEETAALAAKYAASADEQRRLAPEVVAAVREAGFARHFVPRRWGGDASTFGELVPAVARIGEACTSAAWVAALSAAIPRMAAHLPIDGQREVWAEGPDTLVVGALMPQGRAQAVPGGWRLSGEWSYISGVDFAQWALVCCMVAGDGAPQPWYFAVPRSAYTLLDTWFTVGMRGTGSNTLILEDVFVPEHRSMPRERVMSGRGAQSPAACHNVPLKAVNGLPFSAPALGAARGMLNAWSAAVADSRAAGRPGSTGAESATLAHATAALDVAQLLLQRAAGVADAGEVSSLQAVRNALDCCVAINHLVRAADVVFSATGTRGQSATHPAQRSWRDVHAIASHLVLRFDPAAEAYAEELFRAGGAPAQ